MRKLFITTLCVVGCITTATAQETIAINTGDITSPELNATTRCATFRMAAPNAQKVELEASFLPQQKVQTPFGEMEQTGRAAMTRDSQGV